MWDWKSDPEAPWWVKLRRARLHIDEVHQRVRTLDASGPWSVEKEPAEDPDSWAFRFGSTARSLRTCGPLWPMR